MPKKHIHTFALLIILVLLSNTRITHTQNPEQTSWELQIEYLIGQLRNEGIADERVLAAIKEVPRHLFVPEVWRKYSYENRPLPIGEGQTISQPFIVAYMCQMLELDPNDVVLEIGTGSGYHAAIMSRLAKKVYTIEIIPKLGLTAQTLLDTLGFDNVEVHIGDGYQGLAQFSPFDKIILTAAPHKIPQALLEQVKVGGRIVAPIGNELQELTIIERTEDGYESKPVLPVRFVPMTGEAENK